MEPEEIGKVRIPRDDEVLGIVESMLGSNKLRVRCQDNVIRTCRIPGKMRKRIWMREGDVVLVKPWEFDKEKGDVIWSYRHTQAAWLRKRNILTI